MKSLRLIVEAKKKPAKKAPPKKLSKKGIDAYVELLDKHLNDEPAFHQLFAKLKSDKSVGQEQLLKIHNKWMSYRAPKATSKSKLLKRIYARHADMIVLKMKIASRAGRSAA